MTAKKLRPELSPYRPTMPSRYRQHMAIGNRGRQQAMRVGKQIFFAEGQKDVRCWMGLVHPRLEPSPYRMNFVGRRHGRSPLGESTGEGNFPNNGLRSEKGSHRNDAGQILLIAAGIQQTSESSERNTGQPDRAVPGNSGWEKHILMELIEDRPIGVVAKVGVHEQHVNRPTMSSR